MRVGTKSAIIVLVAVVAVVIAYVAGVLVRGSYGIRVTVENASSKSIHEAQVRVNKSGPVYRLGDIDAGHHRRVYVNPKGESSIYVTFIDGDGISQGVMAVGYAEHDYCGKSTITIYPERRIATKENVDIAFCWGSWFDFI